MDPDKIITILLIEDDEDDYILLKHALKNAAIPHVLKWISTYEQGLTQLLSKSFDICFVDYRLGSHTGLELLSQIRLRGLLQPVIMLTGQGSEELGLEAIREGADDYLVKGEIIPNLLRRSVRYTLERSRLRQKEEELLQKMVVRRTSELKTLIDMVPIGIGIAQDPECDIIYPNNEFARMMQIDSNQNASITSKLKPPFKIIVNGTEATGHELPMHLAARTGEAVRGMEFELQHPDGKKTIILGYSFPLFDENNKVRGAVGAFLDITYRKDIERRKDEFIGIASHELKTPLTSMKSFVQILEKRTTQKGDKKDIYILSNITKQVDRLNDLINNLLNVNRITEGRLELHKTWVNLDELIKKVVIDFQYSISSHEIIKEGELGKNIYIDENRVEQVLSNLITNAIKYSPNANKVIIRIARENNFAVISVEDFGMGVAKKDQEKIFERFYRTEEKENTTISGFGLGLYISSEIIHRHNGKVWVKSGRGKGSTFSFSLPLENEK